MEIHFKFWGTENNGKYISRVYVEVDGEDAGYVEYRSSRFGGASYAHTLDDGLYNELVEIMTADWESMFESRIKDDHSRWNLFAMAVCQSKRKSWVDVYSQEYADGIVIDYNTAA